MPAALPGKQKVVLPLLEKDIQKACEDLLRIDGWDITHLEQNYSEKKRKRIGEAGAADCQAVRPIHNSFALAQVIYIEWKRKSGVASAAQKEWHRYKRKIGLTTWLAGEQFEPTYDGFKAYYEASGLCRRRLR